MEKKKLLIIDDEASVLKVCQMALSKLSLEIETAPGEARAIKLLKEKPFDIVLVDLKLKEKDGLKIIKNARALHPRIKTILMTGTLSSDELKAKIEKAKIDKIIFKPFTIDQLRDVVGGCLFGPPPIS